MFEALIRWSQESFSDLPWRRRRSLYRTLVSEIMLQQTTVTTVRRHFEAFVERFPDVGTLAQASEEELLVAWKGLGYYRRARNLKKIAEAIARDHRGKFPPEIDLLQTIPGIGPYTANALVAMGMDRPALAVDANLERVLARYYGVGAPTVLVLQKRLAALFVAGDILPERHHSFRALNEALMDLGRTVCQARRVACELCPLARECVARRQGDPLALPFNGAAKKAGAVEHRLVLLRVVVSQGDEVLAYQKAEDEWLSGQWEVPTFVVSSTDEEFRQYPALRRKIAWEGLPEVKTGITKYHITNKVLALTQKDWAKWKFGREVRWRDRGPSGNLSTSSGKALVAVQRPARRTRA